MMTNPEATFTTILNFIEEPLDRLPEFLENIEMHRQKSFARTPAKTISHGLPIYHTKNIPKHVLREMDALMKEEAGCLYEKYLKRYEES